ncbi:MAG: SURF1 family protein, partial [Acidimicrobiia bacterium]
MPRAQIRPSYRFALQPSWLVRHALALVALAVMITACFWQLSRLSDKQARNRLYDERAAQPVEAVDAVVPLDATAERVEAVRFRLLAATGTYRPDEEVFVRSRSLDGQPGAWVLTPLALQGRPGEAVVVNRGWIPSADTTPELPAGAEAPAGTVTVTGLALATE